MNEVKLKKPKNATTNEGRHATPAGHLSQDFILTLITTNRLAQKAACRH